MKTCTYCGKENEDSETHCTCCATSLPEQTATPPPTRRTVCPHCGQGEDFEVCLPLRRLFSWRVLILGGFLIAAVHCVSRKSRVKCDNCGGFFYLRTGAAKVYLAILILLIALALLGFIEVFAGE